MVFDGVVRARFRNGLETAGFIDPGAFYRYEIDQWFTSNGFLLGYRIALAVSSSNLPLINRNLD